MPNSAQLNSNYQPISTALYDPVGKQFIASQAGAAITSSDGVVYGSHIYSNVDGQRATYSASVLKLAVATGANIIWTLTGSATKTVRVTRLEISGTCATTAKDINFFIAKYSTAATGGTAGTAPTIFPHDSSSAAATASIGVYTADPTAGTLLGNLRTGNLFMAVTGGAAATGLYTATFGDRPGAQSIVLRGTTQQIAISLNAENTATSIMDVVVEWTEDSFS